MSRHLAPSKPLPTGRRFFDRYSEGMSANDIQRVTGWSKATFFRRSALPDFPAAHSLRGSRKFWHAIEVLEWVSKFNLMAIMPRETFDQFERDLADRGFADPHLKTHYGRLVEREIVRRMRVDRTI